MENRTEPVSELALEDAPRAEPSREISSAPKELLTLPPDPEPLSLDPDPPHHRSETHHFIHRILRTTIAILSLFLVLRMVAAEPFGVPTGSMAPTLIGNHREGSCPRCGHPVRIGEPSRKEDRVETFEDANCPNCGLAGIDLTGVRDISGDRLMVDKNIFHLRSPRRWEVAVFRCPVDSSKPYVKRTVGLPGEEITIHDGDVYANGELLRKGLAEVREMRQPFFNLNFAPSPRGWADRWLVEPVHADPRLPGEVTLAPKSATPADAALLHDGALHLDAAKPDQSVELTYRHTKVDDDNREIEVRAWNSYNGPPRRNAPAVHDFALTCELEVQAGDDGLVSFRLYDGADSVTLDLAVGTNPAGLASLTHEKHATLASAKHSLAPGRTYKLEFSFFDRRAIVAVDGKELFAADLPAEEKRDVVRRPLQLGARGCQVVVQNLKLFHDIHYTHGGQTDIASWQLGGNEYFMMGDNTTNSQDSREWRDPEPDPQTGVSAPRPGVTEGAFLGKPFFIHQPLRLGRMTIGGREYVFQTIDWSRLRWLH